MERVSLSTNLNPTMSNTRIQKRLREIKGETTESEPPAKRQKLTRNLQLLYGEVKEKSQLLDAELRELLEHLPTNESAARAGHGIKGIQRVLEKITTTCEVRRLAVFDIDFGTIFPEEIIAQLSHGG